MILAGRAVSFTQEVVAGMGCNTSQEVSKYLISEGFSTADADSFATDISATAAQKLQRHQQETCCACEGCDQVFQAIHGPLGNLLVSPQEQLKLCCTTVTMYHGTTREAADQIERSGPLAFHLWYPGAWCLCIP